MSYKTIYFIFLLLLISWFIIESSRPPISITIDIDKGIVLRQIGFFTEKREQSVFHILIPLYNPCIDSPDTDVCRYTRSNHWQSAELSTMLPDSVKTVLNYSKDDIRRIVELDMRRVFSTFEVHEFVAASNYIVYFIDNHFYAASGTENSSSLLEDSLIARDPILSRHRTDHLAKVLLQQTTQKKIGFEFLTEDQVTEILPILFSTSFPTMSMKELGQYTNDFVDLIVGQSISIVKSCSLNGTRQSSSVNSCLVFSTVIRRLPSEMSSTFKIFQAIPLPISSQRKLYMYQNIPKTFGYNSVEKKVMVWNDIEFTFGCIHSFVVQCQSNPIIIPISNIPCLSQLLTGESSSIDQCSVIQLSDIYVPVLNIESNLWYFHSTNESFICEWSSSTTAMNNNMVLIRSPMLITLPCHQAIQCSGFRLPVTKCIDYPIFIKTKHNSSMDQQFSVSVSLMNIVDRLTSNYHASAETNLVQLETQLVSGKSFMRKHLDELVSVLASLLCFVALSIFLFVLRFIKRQMLVKVDEIRREVNQFQRDILDEIEPL